MARGRRFFLAARVLTVAVAIALTAWALPAAFGSNGNGRSSAAGAYGNAYGLHRVAVCHKGHTIYIAPPAVTAHLAHGDTMGACD